MAPKAAAAASKKEEPKAKKAKTEEADKEPEKAELDDAEAEKEKDAPQDKRPLIKENVSFDPANTTLNVLPTFGGKVLMAVQDGGMQYLIAGARANVGMKAGRYMFEAKVVETLNPVETTGNRGKVPFPRQLMRVGVSLAGSSLILGEDEEGVCFDAEGSYIAEKKKTPRAVSAIGKHQTIAVVINLDEKSPNYHSISLFRNGQRLCEPQKLPEAWKGKTLYPHVCYRNITLQVNFDATPLFALPFKCRSLAAAAVADVEVLKPAFSKDGKYEVMFPVGFPDEGTFDWLDTFVEKNPQYVELSDRKLVEWGARSGLVKPKSTKGSRDKPDLNYGLSAMDDLSVRKVLDVVAPLVPRNYIVMEVKDNLTEADRKANLKRFADPIYKKVARVMMGEPDDAYKKVTHSKILKEKKDKAEIEWKKKKAEKDRKKQLAARQKQLAEMQKAAAEKRKKAEEEKKAKAAEAAKKRAELIAKKKAEAEAKKREEDGGLGAENETKDAPMEEAKKDEAQEETKKEEVEAQDKEEKKEEKEEEEKKEEEPEEEEEDAGPEEVELDEEDKKRWFYPPAEKDLTPQVLSQAFGKFCLPKKEEGFDEILYEWQGAEKANDYLRSWVLKKKLSAPCESLKPSDWFREIHTRLVKTAKEWQEKQKPFQAKMLAKQKEKEKKAIAAAAAGEDVIEEDLGADSVDVFAVDDVLDVGNGEPLFVNFTWEDWALLALRWDLVLLVQAFKRDIDDEDYVGIHEPNLAFYYNKYFQKQLNTKHYGKDSVKDLLELVKDCVVIDQETNVLTVTLANQDAVFESGGELIFVKIVEETRRERQRRADAGDETARLKFLPVLKATALKAAAQLPSSIQVATKKR